MPAVEDIRISTLVNPTPKQRECIEATDRYRFVLYGGAAGGGKSYLLRWWGWHDHFRDIVSRVPLPRYTLDFAGEWDTWSPIA